MSAQPQFQRGDVLVIQPADGDDPEANSRVGQRCRFLKYGVAGHVAVEVEGARRPFYFRPQDVARVEEGGNDFTA
jgi:hypothetical protein